MGFEAAFQRLARAGTISPPDHRRERIYEGEGAPDGHESDIAYITTFRRR